MSESIKVLFIEDNPGDARLVKEELRLANSKTIIHLEWVDRLEQGLERLASNHIQAILLDLSLPDSQGLDTLRRVLTNAPAIPVIVITGQASEAVALQAVQGGAQDYLIKGQVDGRLLIRSIQYAIQRKQAEEKLLASEVRYRRLFEAAKDGILILDVDSGEIQDVNPFLMELLGYSAAEFRGKQLWEIGLFKDIAANKESFQELQAKGYIRYENLPLQTRRGGQIFVEFVSNVYDVNEKKIVQCNVRDITERKRAEEAVRESQERLSGMIGSAMDAIITIDEEQRVILFNPAAEQMFHYFAADVIGRPLDFLLPERVRAIHHQHVRIFGETGLTRRAMGALEPLSGLRADGEEFPIEASISQLESGGRKFYTVILRDITARKRAEAAVLESEARYHGILDAMMEGCQIIDFDWRYVYVNDVVAQQGKHRREELLNHTMMEMYPGIENTSLFANLRQCMEERIPRHMQNQFVFPDASIGWFELSIQPTREGIFILSTDITERKQAEEALREKNEEIKRMSQQLWQAAKLATMGELAASIAHELNNPLATVSLRAEMLQARFSPDDTESRSLQIIHSEIKRMGSLVANLLQFSRRSASQISTIKVNEEVANTLELIQYHLRKHGILTVQELSPETPLIQADRQQLRQVFLNLFTNAADAMPLGGLLTIRTWSGEKPKAGITAPLKRQSTASLGPPASGVSQVFIEVSDSGEGIPPEMLDKVWEPFYTTKPEGKGTGLGLAICRRIIQEHGGTIEVTSEGIPGRGTTVRISFPAVKER